MMGELPGGPGACLHGDARRGDILLVVRVVGTRVEWVGAADHGTDPKCWSAGSFGPGNHNY